MSTVSAQCEFNARWRMARYKKFYVLLLLIMIMIIFMVWTGVVTDNRAGDDGKIAGNIVKKEG